MRNILLSFKIIACLLLSHQVKANTIDTLHTILLSKENKEQKQQRIARLCYNRFLRSSAYDQRADAMSEMLAKYELSGGPELRNFAKILIYRRKFELERANELLTQAIGIAIQHSEKIFLYQFYLNQAYVQTDLGNSLNAVYSYRLARKMAEELGNSDLLVTTDIGISDIYTNIGLYPQALIYLDQAQEAYNQQNQRRASTQKMIYLNKAEAHFKIGQLDSLNHYIGLADKMNGSTVEADQDLKRAQYFKLILEKKYQLAIPLIKDILETGTPYYRNLDLWYLAESFYHNGQSDSAIVTANQIAKYPYAVSSLIRLNAYQLLANIAQDKKQIEKANHFLKLALTESEDYTLRISKIGDLASELRLDRMESGYISRNLIYRRERTILAMTVIVAILITIVIFVFYRNIKQKNHFQKLVHQAHAEELLFINSHQVRKPLANIIGICSLLDGGQPNEEEIRQYLQYVYHEAKEMDDRLRDVEKKLNN